MGYRRKARQAALQMLYAREFTGDLSPEAMEGVWELNRHTSPRLQRFAMDLVEGVIRNLPRIDATIQGASLNWRLERMSLIDKNILRIAVFEILFVDDIPFRVSIDEAIEIGKLFGSGDSRAFVNGILDRVVSEMRKAK